jgi:hypothetical protein
MEFIVDKAGTGGGEESWPNPGSIPEDLEHCRLPNSSEDLMMRANHMDLQRYMLTLI